MTIQGCRINILCLIGAAIGICSFFIPWVLTVQDQNLDGILEYQWYHSLFDLLDNSVFAWLFVLATISALFTPIAGFIQLIGWYCIYWSVGIGTTGGTGVSYNEIGYAIGFLSFTVVILSILRPMGVGFSKKPLSIKERLLTFSQRAK